MERFRFVRRLRRYIMEHPWRVGPINWAKTHSFPGLKRIPLYNLLVFIEKETQDDAITTRANSMAYSFFMAIFPGIIVLISLLPYIPFSMDFFGTLEGSIKEVMPGKAGELIFKTVKDIATIPKEGLLSAGFFLAIWFASNGMLSMMKGLEKDYPSTFKRRTTFQKRLIAIQLTFLVGFVLVASVILVILGNTILEFVFQFIKVGLLTQIAFFSLRWVVVLLLFYTLFSMIYRFGSSTHHPIPFFNPGAILATPLSILSSWGFSFYVDNFGNYNKLYGSIGTLIVLMIWIQLNCMILLIGFELNAGIAVLRDQRKITFGADQEQAEN